MQIKGYESRLRVELTGPDDLTGATLIADVASYGCESEVLGRLSTSDGSIEVSSTLNSGAEEGYEYTSEIDLIFDGDLTADWPDFVITDVVRTDGSASEYLGFKLKIPFDNPITVES